jgi:NAD(P)H-dependent FMN reductase
MEEDYAGTIASRGQSPAFATQNEWTDVFSCLQQTQQEQSLTQADVIYWKLVVAPLHLSGSVTDAATAQQLYSWLALQLRRGTPSTVASGMPHWEETSLNHPQGLGAASAALLPTVRACFTFPDSNQQFANALAGASGIILVVSTGENVLKVINDWLSKQGPLLPVLVLAASPGAATSVRQHVIDMGSEALQPIQVVPAFSASTTGLCASTIQSPAFYSRSALFQGLQWLATQAPLQPSLHVRIA